MFEPQATMCPLCGSKRVRGFSARANDVVQQKFLSLVECLDCGLAWQYPRSRSAEESIEYFSGQYSQAREDTYFDSSKRGCIAKAEFEFLSQLIPEPAFLLDIGAGDGAFVGFAAGRGWKCLGIDPSAKEPREMLPEFPGRARIIPGEIEQMTDSSLFDVVTMWDVIEHVDRPDRLIAEAIRRLRPEGILVIETGNYQSADRVEGGSNWWCYQEDHRWYFSPIVLERLLLECGLTHVWLGTRTLRPWWRGSRMYTGPSKLSTLKNLLRQPSKAAQLLVKHMRHKSLRGTYAQTAGLPIFTLVASRSPSTLTCNDEIITRIPS